MKIRNGILFIVLLMMLLISSCGKSYTYTFVDRDGNIIKQETIKSSDKIIFPEDLADIVDGEYTYHFTGWSSNETKISKDITIRPLFDMIVNKYTYTFYDMDRKTIIKQVTAEYGDTIIYPDNPSTKQFEGYQMVFNRWNNNETILLGDTVFYATYKRVNDIYTITYLDYDNELFSKESIEYMNYAKGEKDPNTSIDKTKYYKFLGWIDQNTNELFDFNTQITKNYTLKPLNESGEYGTISLKDAGISILSDSISTFYDASSSVNSIYHGTNEYYYPIYSTDVKSVDKTWWYQAITGVGATLFINNSLSGSAAYGASAKAGQSYTRLSLLGAKGKPNIVFVYMGSNDNVNGHTIAQIESAYRVIIEYINENFVDKKGDYYIKPIIYLFTNGYSAYSGYEYTEDRRLQINKLFTDLAKEYGDNVRIFDLASVVTKDNYIECLNDSLHYNAYGMKLIADSLVAQLKTDFGENKKEIRRHEYIDYNQVRYISTTQINYTKKENEA